MLAGGLLAFWLVELFLIFAEYYFFEEFRSRFNTVAVDYLLYPHEVFVNIWDTYPVGWVVAGCMVLAGLWVGLALHLFKPMWQTVVPWRVRSLYLLGAIVLAAGLSRSISLKEIQVSSERVLNEISNNGALSFVSAFWTRNLDFVEFYKTLPREEAYQRARRLLSEPNVMLDPA